MATPVVLKAVNWAGVVRRDRPTQKVGAEKKLSTRLLFGKRESKYYVRDYFLCIFFIIEAIRDTPVGRQGVHGAADISWSDFKAQSMIFLKGQPRAANARRNLPVEDGEHAAGDEDEDTRE